MNGVERGRKGQGQLVGRESVATKSQNAGHESEEARAERLQRKLIKYFAVDEEKIKLDPQQTGADPAKWVAMRHEMAEYSRDEALASFDVEVDEALKEKILDEIVLGKIGTKALKKCLLRIRGPLQIEEEGARTLFTKLEQDGRQKQILTVAVGGTMRDWRKANAKMVYDLLQGEKNERFDFTVPIGFEKFRREFLKQIAKRATDEQYGAYEKSIEELERTLYGRRLDYYREFQKLEQEANAKFGGETKRPLRSLKVAKTEKLAQGENYVDLRKKSGGREYEAMCNFLLQKTVIYGDAWEINGREYRLSAQQLNKAGLMPVFETEIDGRKIYLSEIFQLDSGWPAVIAYVLSETDEVVVNSYYRSLASGSWFLLPDFVRRTNSMKIDWYGEGYGFESLLLPIKIQESLAEIENAYGKKQIRSANTDFLFAGMTKGYDSKQEYVERLALKQMSGNYYDEVESQPYNHDFLMASEQKRPPYTQSMNVQVSPDFTRCQARYETTTQFTGPVIVEAFASRNGEYMFAFNRDTRGRVWISQIENVTSTITLTGLRMNWVAASDFTTPLYTASGTTGQYGDPSDTRGSYQCMWKNYLSQLPVIQEYLEKLQKERKQNKR